MSSARPVAHVGEARLDQQVHGVGADGAARERVALARQREPAGGLAARDVGEDARRKLDAGLLLRTRQRAHVLVPEPLRRHLVAGGDERLDARRVDPGHHRGHREGRLEPMLGERRQHQVEPLAGGEQRRSRCGRPSPICLPVRRPCSGRRRCGRRTACRPASGYPCRRGSSRPRSCSRLSRALAASSVVVTPPSASPDVARGSAAPPPRRSQTKRLAASSCARSGGRAWRCAGPAPTRRDAGRC